MRVTGRRGSAPAGRALIGGREPGGGRRRLDRMRWWILGAVLGGWAAAIAAGGFAGAAGPLRLELEPERLWCTAGTFVQVDWRAVGGEPPYAVTVQGERVEGSGTGTIRVDCDALPFDDGEPASHGEMIVRAEAADAAGLRVTAAERVLLAPALPAPSGLAFEYRDPYFRTILEDIIWEPVVGVGSLDTFEGCLEVEIPVPCVPHLLRYRAVGADQWSYYNTTKGPRHNLWERGVVGISETQVAALRHRFEWLSPDALNWSETVRFAAAREGGAVASHAWHDRLEVVWGDPGRHARATIELHGPDGVAVREYRRGEDAPWDAHHETFDRLRPDQRYTLKIIPSEGEPIELEIMTAPLPARGPAALGLQLSTNGSCTAGTETDIRWQAAGGSPPYEVEIAGVRAAGAEGTARIECGALPRGWRGPRFGYLPRTIRGTANDAAGATAGAETILLTGPPLAPPRIELLTAGRDEFSVSFQVRASEIGDSTWFAALRWREAGEIAWSYSAGGVPVSWDRISTGPGLASATLFEAQVALGRSAAEIERPQALAWSESARRITRSDPLGLVAEATHDSISLSWGPEVEGLWFFASASPTPATPPGQRLIHDPFSSPGHLVESGPPYGLTWTDLCPDTQYFVSVSGASVWPDAQAGLAIATEPAPEPLAEGPMVEAEVEPDRITLRWAEDACVLHPDYRVSVREYGSGFELRGGSGSWGYLERSDETREIAGLRPGSTYEIVLSPWYEPRADDIRLVAETPEREYEALSDAEPPKFLAIHGKWREGGRSFTGFRIHTSWEQWITAELEWHVEGRRMRRLIREHAPTYVYGLPPGWYEFRMRGLSGSEGPTRWSEPVRAATTPIAPKISSDRYQGEHLIVTWDEPEDGIPIDRYIVEWRIHQAGEEWQGIEVETGGWAAIPRAPFTRGGDVRLTAVSDEYGAGSPSADRPVGPPARPKIRLGIDARGCGRDGRGTFDVAWIIEHGVPPFRLRLRPINSPAEAPETVVIEGNDREGRRQFQCADAARSADGDWEVAVGFRLTDYRTHLETAAGIRSERFGATSWRDDRSRGRPEQQLGPRHGEMPAPGTARRSVHATHVKWKFGLGHDHDQLKQRWVVRMRAAAEAEWIERELIYGRWPVNWWYVDDLEPGTRYEYAFGRYFEGGSEWSETGVVTTLEDVAGITVSEADGAIAVEWDSQPDAWKYLVRLRGQGRSWWAIPDATDAVRERIEFRAAGHGPYTAEVVTPPQYAGGGDISTFELWPLT